MNVNISDKTIVIIDTNVNSGEYQIIKQKQPIIVKIPDIKELIELETVFEILSTYWQFDYFSK